MSVDEKWEWKRTPEESLASIADSLKRLAVAAEKITGKGYDHGTGTRVERGPEGKDESVQPGDEGSGGIDGAAVDRGIQRDREHEENVTGTLPRDPYVFSKWVGGRPSVERCPETPPPPPEPTSAEKFEDSGTRWVLERTDETGVVCYLANCGTRSWTTFLKEAHRFVKKEHAEASIGMSDAVPAEVYDGERK